MNAKHPTTTARTPETAKPTLSALPVYLALFAPLAPEAPPGVTGVIGGEMGLLGVVPLFQMLPLFAPAVAPALAAALAPAFAAALLPPELPLAAELPFDAEFAPAAPLLPDEPAWALAAALALAAAFAEPEPDDPAPDEPLPDEPLLPEEPDPPTPASACAQAPAVGPISGVTVAYGPVVHGTVWVRVVGPPLWQTSQDVTVVVKPEGTAATSLVASQGHSSVSVYVAAPMDEPPLQMAG